VNTDDIITALLESTPVDSSDPPEQKRLDSVVN
jgi:hypothetical protein